MVFIWKFLVRPLGGAFDLYELLPAFAAGILVNGIVSLLTQLVSKEIADVFDEVKSEK